ncbi:MAG TPA: anti-sigma factor [Jatrophihabitantaceae bacterium]|jgi:hypothetical protein|nr:anti-sigma factor [Jatrophihabitantaceae bacterium]
MTEHAFDELPGLLSGSADRATVARVAAHLRNCEDCRHELISAAVAHAALTSAMRIAPGLVAHDQPRRDAIDTDMPLPDLSAVFANVRPRNRARWLVAAAVAVVAVASGSVIAITDSGGHSSRSVALAAFGAGKAIDGGAVSGTAQLIGNDQVELNASALPAPAAGQYYEVWLTDSARVTVVPVGQLDTHGRGDFSVSPSEVNRYSAIEISLQDTASSGKFSNVSVLRGSYT